MGQWYKGSINQALSNEFPFSGSDNYYLASQISCSLLRIKQSWDINIWLLFYHCSCCKALPDILWDIDYREEWFGIGQIDRFLVRLTDFWSDWPLEVTVEDVLDKGPFKYNVRIF